MIKPFIFLDHTVWKKLDPVFLPKIKPEYKKWFDSGTWNAHSGHLASRVHKLNTPWPLIPQHSVAPLDNKVNWVTGETDFDLVIDSIAQEYVEYTLSNNLSPIIFWSGGIDSTCVLVSFLKNNCTEFLDRLQIVCNKKSFMENPYFYDQFIQGKFETIDTDHFKLTQENSTKIVLFDGEGGNQVFGSGSIYDLARKNQFDLLDRPYQSLLNLPYSEGDRHLIDLVVESLPYCPVSINTVYDFLWWSNFNFKFDSVLLRKILVYTHILTPSQRKSFWDRGLKRVFAHPDMQRWSLNSLESRHRSLKVTTKHAPKKYIYDFDGNEIYFYQKRETTSLTDVFLSRSIGGQGAIGINQDWELVDMKNRDHRRAMGSLLTSWT